MKFLYLLRHDLVFGALLGKLEPKRRGDCAALAGKSTLNRLELHATQGNTRYHKIRPDGQGSSGCGWSCFSTPTVPPRARSSWIWMPPMIRCTGIRRAGSFHDYYDGYCYLPLYIFAGEHLLCAKLRRSNIDGAANAREEVKSIVAQIRERWPAVRIILRADSASAARS